MHHLTRPYLRRFPPLTEDEGLECLVRAIDSLPELQPWHGLHWKRITNLSTTFSDRPRFAERILKRARVSLVEAGRPCASSSEELPAPIRMHALVTTLQAAVERGVVEHVANVAERARQQRRELFYLRTPRHEAARGNPVHEAHIVFHGAHFNTFCRIYEICSRAVTYPEHARQAGCLRDGKLSIAGVTFALCRPAVCTRLTIQTALHSTLDNFLASVLEPATALRRDALTQAGPLVLRDLSAVWDHDDFREAALLAQQVAQLLWRNVVLHFGRFTDEVTPNSDLHRLERDYEARLSAQSVLRRWASGTLPLNTEVPATPLLEW